MDDVLFSSSPQISSYKNTGDCRYHSISVTIFESYLGVKEFRFQGFFFCIVTNPLVGEVFSEIGLVVDF